MHCWFSTATGIIRTSRYKYTACTNEICRGFCEAIVRLSGDRSNTDHGHIFTIPKRLTFYNELYNSDALATTVIENALVSKPNLKITVINSKLLDQGG
jgi:hypothetical protein